MENFFYNENFHLDLDSLLCDLGLYEEKDVQELPDDWSINIQMATLEPVCQLNGDELIEVIIDYIEDTFIERFPEDSDKTFDKIKQALIHGVYTNEINEAMPRLYYPNQEFQTITKQDLLEYIK